MEHQWAEDGHKVFIVWDRDQLVVDRVECPFEGTNAYCNRLRDFCVVQRFVGLFGAESNVGVAQVMGGIEVAWLGVPGDSDLDHELAGVWITPINDPDYRMFKESQSLDE